MEENSHIKYQEKNLKLNFTLFNKDLSKKQKETKIFNLIKYIKNKIKINNNVKINNVKVRNPGIDLFRIITMYFIILHHLLFHGRGLVRYRKCESIINIIIMWHINGFGLISGIIGYKTTKYSNLFYLWLMVSFYNGGIYYYFNRNKPFSYIYNSISKEIFPVIFPKYWYFNAYFKMYLLLPAINRGLQNLSKSELKILVFSLYSLCIIWNGYKNPKRDVFGLGNGFTSSWLIILFITGAYIGKYNFEKNGIKKYNFCFICLLIFIFSSLFYYYLNKNNKIKGYYYQELIIILKNFFRESYLSIHRILQSISVALLLLQIKYNKYIAKIVSFFGPLTFGVYLIHDNIIVRTKIIAIYFKNVPNNLSCLSNVILVCLKGIKIYVICFIIDYVRHEIFIILRIRKILIFLEKLTFKILG